jgi:ATP-binding cassette subfamily B protein
MSIKRVLHKAIPALVMALAVGALTLVLDAFLNITMMKTIDSAMALEDDAFKMYVLRLLLLTLAVLPLNVLMAWLKGRYRMKSMRHLKYDYLNQVFKKDLAAFDAQHSTDYVSAMTQDMTIIENGYVAGRFEIIYQGFSFIIGLVVLVYVSPWIPVFGAALAAIVSVISIVLSKPIKAHQKRRSDLFQSYSAYIQSCLSAFHIIKVNHLSDKAREDFYHKSMAIQHQGFIIDKLNTFIFALQNLMMSSLMIGMVGAGAYLTIKGQMTFGGIILVVTSAERIMGPIQVLGEWLPKMTASKVLFDKMDQQLKEDMQASQASIVEKFDLKKGLSLKAVSFEYKQGDMPGNQVLDSVNLNLEKGGKYLVMGPSGGGKSTLLKLLRKYYTPTNGEIYVDDYPLSDISHEVYYQLIANVEQHVFLFEDSLLENLCLYKSYSQDVIDLAIERSGLTELVSKLPEGLDTLVKDNGKNLSGGERSRIAIARALLQEAQILILDEAFSSLDDSIAKEIEKTLLSLSEVTLINVSHVCFEETKVLYNRIYKVAHMQVA